MDIYKFKRNSWKQMLLLQLLILCVCVYECRPTVDNDPQQPPMKRATKKNASAPGNSLVYQQPTNKSPTKDVDRTLHTPHPKKHEHPAWLVYTSAVPTVVIFLICLLVIAYKNRNDNGLELIHHDDVKDDKQNLKPKPKPITKKKSKSKINQRIYDEMLAKFKDEKNRKRSFVGRKSSQIRIEGMVSRSPKSLARKHIIIGQLNEEDLAPNEGSSALGQLVQLSTHTFIGSSLIEDMEPPNWNEEAREQVKEDVTARLIMENDDENDALLPDDLEDVFRNFGNWEESLI